MKERIISFDALRYILALCVVFGHTLERLYPVEDAVKIVIHTLAVDGFFIISGFLIASSVLRHTTPEEDNNTLFLTLTKRRFFRLWPEYFFAFLLVFTLGTFFIKQPEGVLIPLNLLFVSYINGIPGIMNGSWYICVLFFGGAMLQYLLICKRKQAVYFWFPLLIFFSFSYIYGQYGNLVLSSRPLMWGVISAGLIRGLMEMSIGIECYFASQYISQTDFHFRPWAKKVLPVAWELLGLYFILYAWLHKGGNTSNFFVLFGYVIVILLLAQRKEFFLRFLSWKNWQFIAPTAYMLFLTHVIWQKLVYKYVPYKQYPQWAVCLGLLLFCSIFGWFWYQAYKHYFAKLKKALFLPR